MIEVFQSFSKIITKQKNMVIIPFTVKPINNGLNYNSTNFLNDHLFSTILLNLNIGSPSQKVTGKVEQYSKCFAMEIINSTSPSYMNLYSPLLSTTITKRTAKLYYETMNFDNHNESYKIDFTVGEVQSNFNFSNYKYTPVIGLNIPIYDNPCPNFFVNIKKKGLINELIWTIEFVNNSEGNLVIGEDLPNYNDNKYSRDNYYTTYINLNFLLTFDSIYINDKYNENKNYYMNMTQSMIFNNYGLIIGPNEYKQLIDKLFFNDLIKKDICKSDIIFYEYNIRTHAGLNYSLYSCDDKKFTDKTNNYFDKFPELVFSLRSIGHNFILSKEDLFVHIGNKFYFSIIFQTNSDVKEIVWCIGEIFYKKYTTSLNFDQKRIGFYLPKENDENKEKEKGKDENKTRTKLIITISVEIFVLAALIISIIILAIRIKTRKNRVNEINDDNYEYLSNNNDKNDKNNKKLNPEIN